MMRRLSKPQQLIYDTEKYLGGAVNVLCGSVLLPGSCEPARLTDAANELRQLNSVLRTHILENGSSVLQEVLPYVPEVVPVLEFENKAALDAYAQSFAKEPIPLTGPLCRFQAVILPEKYGLLAKLHHMIGDAWTMALLGSQLEAILHGQTPVAHSYDDYLMSEEKYLNSPRYEKDRVFFLEQYRSCDEPIFLSDRQDNSTAADRSTFVVAKEQADTIKQYAEVHQASPFAVFLTALASYLNRVKMNAEKFYIGTAVLNRTGPRERNTAGMFINTVPLLVEAVSKKTFGENLASVQETVFATFRHQKFQYSDVLSTLREQTDFSGRLYDVMLSYQNAAITGAEQVETAWYPANAQTESLVISIDDRDNEGIFRFHYDYLTDRFTAHQIEMLHEHLMNLLLDGIKNEQKQLWTLNILTEDEKQKLLHDFNDTSVDYPKDKCIHQLFEEQAERMPDKVAVVACDKTLTYQELNKQANCVAHSLLERGVKIGDMVAFILHRRSYLIAAMLGILKAGAAYLPIDPDSPLDRIEYILSDSNSKLCLSDETIQDFITNDLILNPRLSVSSHNPCYCIYTSGSTGKPKGVLIPHSNVINYCHSMQRLLDLSDNRFVSVNSDCFDAFIDETLLPLLCSCSVVLASERELQIQSEFLHLLKKTNPDIISTTPTRFELLFDNIESGLSSIKTVVFGGEEVHKKTINKIKTFSDLRVINTYGPTEATVGTTFGFVGPNDLSIGKPIDNTQVYLVDKYNVLVPVGIKGELCISGDGVGIGYLNRPELTAERFIDNPFGKGKLYKTGDLAYWREDGSLIYVGRNDFQVKIRGLRIELGEIESALQSADGINQAVVVVRKNSEGRQFICAFYSGTARSAQEIRTFIGERLPRYMVPHIFTHLNEMLLTPSGKINRKALPAVDLEHILVGADYVAPENEMQCLLCEIMARVLGLERVGIHDDFFDLGGDSLKAIELISVAHNEGINLNLQSIFDHPTVQKLCEDLEKEQKRTSFAEDSFTDIHRILSHNTVEHIAEHAPCDVGNLLLAGATGFLGAHILADCLDNDNGTICCLVRGSSQAEAEDRLAELLRFYFGNKYAQCGCRIRVLCADLLLERFGLSEETYCELLKSTQTVINCAANVKHYGAYADSYAANVETVLRLIEFCKASDARLIHASTTGVSGNSFANKSLQSESMGTQRFGEDCFFIGQELDNVYICSKFEAEKVILEAMKGGLRANIMRMGNLTSRYSDGVFQKNYESNAFLNRFKGMTELGLFPDYLLGHSSHSEFTPIDLAAEAVMKLTRHFSTEQTVFHIYNPNTVPFERLIDMLRRLGIPLRLVGGAEFDAALQAAGRQEETAHIQETFISDLDASGHLRYDNNIRLDNKFTTACLKQLGFSWPEIDLEYLRKYIDYLRGIGFLEC